MVGKIALGLAQLALSVSGFIFFTVWFGMVLYQYYGQISGDVTVRPVGWIGITGAGLFGAAWTWSLFTSLGFLRAARESSVPPLITPGSE